MIVPLRRLSLRLAQPQKQCATSTDAAASEPRHKSPTFFDSLEAMWSQFAEMVLPKVE